MPSFCPISQLGKKTKNKVGTPRRSQKGPSVLAFSSTEIFELFQEKVLAWLPSSLSSGILENEICPSGAWGLGEITVGQEAPRHECRAFCKAVQGIRHPLLHLHLLGQPFLALRASSASKASALSE